MKLHQHTVLTRVAVESFRGDLKEMLDKYCDYMSFSMGIEGLKWRFTEMREDLLTDSYIIIYEAEITEQEYMWHKLGGKWK